VPTSIPYNHPSLVLGNVADTRVLDVLKQVDSCQSKIDAAQDKLNSFITLKRSIGMTINELVDLDVDITDIIAKQNELDSSISQAAADYLSVRIENEHQIQALREKLSELEIQDGLESPIDLGASAIKKMPLSSESLKLDSQYFSFGSNIQDDTLANIQKFVRSGTGNLGNKSEDVVNEVSSQLQSQFQNHQLMGTLIITASCTHSNISVFQPLVIDPDKAVSCWNSLFGEEDKIDTQSLAENGVPDSGDSSNRLTMITGATYGSSFVGMIHIVNSDEKSSGDLSKIVDQMDEKIKVGGWLVNANGGFGVDESIFEEVKAFLSSQSVSSHISLVTMGATPSISSNNLKLSVSKLSEVDPATISVITEKNNPVRGTISSEAVEAKNEAKLINIQNSRIESMMKAMGKIDHDSNKVIDINSLMQAFENYLTSVKATDKTIGVPISFYLKKLTKQEIIDLWTNKYGIKKTKRTGDNTRS
jgi:hypothetical protein